MDGRDRVREKEASLGGASCRELIPLAREDDDALRVVLSAPGGTRSAFDEGGEKAVEEALEGRRSSLPDALEGGGGVQPINSGISFLV